VAVHRFVYELLRGPVSNDLELDHLCRNRWCCNIDHLESVPHRVNVLRGFSIAAINARRTHCPKGHFYQEEQTYIQVKNGIRMRSCKECRSIADKERRARGNSLSTSLSV
jgi:hypothetical protein